MPSRPDLLARRRRSHELTPTIRDIQKRQKAVERSIITDKRHPPPAEGGDQITVVRQVTSFPTYTSGGGGSGDADAHIADTTDAHDASAISIADAGTLITATDVEGALQEIAAKGTLTQIARWYIDGPLRADTTNHQGPVWELPAWARAALLTEGSAIKANLRVTAAGANVILDIKHATTRTGSQTSIFDGSNYPTIEAGDLHVLDSGSSDGTIDTSPSYLTLSGGFLFLYIRQVGSTANTEGRDLTVQIFAKVYPE